jgi:hypothetical protein
MDATRACPHLLDPLVSVATTNSSGAVSANGVELGREVLAGEPVAGSPTPTGVGSPPQTTRSCDDPRRAPGLRCDVPQSAPQKVASAELIWLSAFFSAAAGVVWPARAALTFL